MANVVKLTFNPFQENTYLVYDESKECIIFDPGCFDAAEKETLVSKVATLQLKPVRLINTHCHVDHIFGNQFVTEHYGLPLEIHEKELAVLISAPQAAMMFGIPFPEPSPRPEHFIAEGSVIEFGNTQLETLFTPGHSPGSLSFYCREDGFLIAGDVLFQGSIGRTDLPRGDHHTLIRSIKEQLFPLDEGVIVYPGHGPETTIGYEREHNPFLTGA